MRAARLPSDHPVIAPGATKIMRCRYSDIEAQATSVAGHEQAYTQLTPGRFDGLLESYVISDRAAFFVETVNRRLRKQFLVQPGHLRIGFLLDEFMCHGNGVPFSPLDTSVNLSSTPIDLHFCGELPRLLGHSQRG
jgi:hypothetical protein